MRVTLAVTLVVVCSFTARSLAALSATADITTSQTSAPFNYTITLHNTGDTSIGTFWFAWTSTPGDYNFLPSIPTVTGGPSNWLSPVTHNPFPGDGYGIEWYNYFGSPIAPGGTGLFQFTSNDSPAVLAGNAYLPPFKVTHSFVYVGFPQTDPGFQLNATVPEPASVAIAMCSLMIALKRRRYRQPD